MKTYFFSLFQLHWRLSQEPIPEGEDNERILDPAYRANLKCKIFLGYTSNMVSCGMREVIRFLVQHKLVDVLVTTAGGIEEDFIKCIAPTYIGSFELEGKALRRKGINRIGNLLMPNDNYCKFEDFMTPILDQMVKEQEEQGVQWSPSKLIHRLGKEIDNPESIYYWCYKNNIPVFSPAIIDGSIGDMIYFHSYRVLNPLRLDIVQDIRLLNDEAMHSAHDQQKTGSKQYFVFSSFFFLLILKNYFLFSYFFLIIFKGMIILGGGLVKHHICNANLMKNGANFSVFINTASDFDGSDSGARPDEALSWGKIHIDANPVKVYAEASLVFPLIVAETFAKYHFSHQDKK